MTAPCKDCKDKRVGCHSTCPKYIEYTKLNEQRKQAYQKAKRKERLTILR